MTSATSQSLPCAPRVVLGILALATGVGVATFRWVDVFAGYATLFAPAHTNFPNASAIGTDRHAPAADDEELSEISRAFPTWAAAHNDTPPPCLLHDAPGHDPFGQREQGAPSNDGLLFLKVDKAGSSTAAGAGARIAVSLAARLAPTNATTSGQQPGPHLRACKNRLSHIWSKRMTNVLETRDRNNSFLFTILRDPAKRAVSDFYFFAVGRGGGDPSEANLLRHLRATENFQLAKCLTRRKATETHPGGTYAMDVNATGEEELRAMVAGVVRDIDFIGTLERLDESMTLLQLILGLDTRDVLFVPAKEVASKGGAAVKKNVTSKVRAYLAEEWSRRNRGDSLLYRAVDHSLDRSIDAIGRSKFEEALERFREAEERVIKECDGPDVLGKGCYWGDSGCNYKCIDQLFFQ